MSLTYFRFPPDLEKFVYFRNPKELNDTFRDELKKAGLHKSLKHNILKPAGERLYIKCLHCDWILNYIWDKSGTDACTLNRFKLYHRHSPFREPLKRMERLLFEPIECLINLEYRIPKIRTYLEYKCAVEPSTTHHLYYRFRESIEATTVPSFQEWYKKFRTQLLILSYPEPTRITCPDILFISCKHALKIHKERGQITGIKILTDKITELSQDLSPFHCVVFYGILGDQKRILFALGIINSNKYYNVYKVLRLFLQCTTGTCESFYTDDVDYLAEAIRQLQREGRFHGEHYIDPESYLENILDQNIREMIVKLVLTKKEEEYRKLFVEYSHTKDDNRLRALQALDERSELYCHWAKKKQRFMGKWNTIEGSKFHKFLVDRINIKRSYAHLLIKIENILRSQREKYEIYCERIIDNVTIENCVPLEFIKPYRITLYQEGFRELMAQVYNTFLINCEATDDYEYKLTEKQEEYYVHELDEVMEVEIPLFEAYTEEEAKFKFSENKFECDCGYLEEMGLPCCHLIKVLIQRNYNVYGYISNYWKIKKDYKRWREYYYYNLGLEKPRRGRPKQSKRNTQKHHHLG